MLIQVELIHLGPLSPRQGEVAKLIVQGFVDKEIARILGIALKTVQVHVIAIYKKLGVLNNSFNSRVVSTNLMVSCGMFLMTSSFSFDSFS